MVSLIKELCANQKTSIKALERELGLGNGTIRRWDDSSPSYEKLQKVADYFGITVAELTGENEKKPALPKENGLDEDLDNELVALLTSLTPEEVIRVTDFISGLIANRKDD